MTLPGISTQVIVPFYKGRLLLFLLPHMFLFEFFLPEHEWLQQWTVLTWLVFLLQCFLLPLQKFPMAFQACVKPW